MREPVNLSLQPIVSDKGPAGARRNWFACCVHPTCRGVSKCVSPVRIRPSPTLSKAVTLAANLPVRFYKGQYGTVIGELLQLMNSRAADVRQSAQFLSGFAAGLFTTGLPSPVSTVPPLLSNPNGTLCDKQILPCRLLYSVPFTNGTGRPIELRVLHAATERLVPRPDSEKEGRKRHSDTWPP